MGFGDEEEDDEAATEMPKVELSPEEEAKQKEQMKMRRGMHPGMGMPPGMGMGDYPYHPGMGMHPGMHPGMGRRPPMPGGPDGDMPVGDYEDYPDYRDIDQELDHGSDDDGDPYDYNYPGSDEDVPVKKTVKKTKELK